MFYFYFMRRKAMALTALLVASFVINLDTTIVNVALPTLVRELHASNSQLQWIVDAYNLVFAALLLVSGSLSDRVGRKGMLLAGLAVFGVASVAGGLTATAGQLIVARCFMGLGAAMVFPATLSLISNIFTGRSERARAIGLWGASTGVAIALGPIVGGWLLEGFSWSSIFFVMAPVAALGAALVAYSVPTSRDPHAPKTDRGGFALSTAAIALLIFTIIEAPEHGWGSTRSVGGFVAGAVLLAAFIAWERGVREPMLDVSLFRNPRFAAASASVTIAFFALFGFIFLITQFFQFFEGYGPLSAGVALIGSVYASLYGSRLSGLLPRTLPAPLASAAHSSAGAGLIVAEHLRHAGDTALAASLHQATSAAFFHGFSAGNLVAAGVAGAGVVMALWLLPAQPLAHAPETLASDLSTPARASP
jgi:EmrB/QacA subfamily drug resistance transporter